MAIATITYQYGAGSGPDNRQILFTRTAGPGTLEARFSVQGTGQALTTIPENQITVEMESTADKLRNMMAARAGQHVVSTPSRLLSTFPPITQDQIISAINSNSATKGGRWIELRNNPGANGLETITNFVIIDPR